MKSFFSKLASSAILTVLCMPVWAAQGGSSNTFTSSQLYVGAESGYLSSKAKEVFTASGFGSFQDSNGVTGGMYGAFLGYQSPAWKSLNLAVEGFYDYDQASSMGFKQLGDWGLSVLPGYLVSDNSKIYARLGYINTRIQTNDIKNNLNGCQLGLGYLHGFGNSFGVRAEYDYSAYQALNIPNIDPFTDNMKLHYTGNVFKMGLEWMLAL